MSVDFGMGMKRALILGLFFLLMPCVLAQQGQIKLLAVKEIGNNTFAGDTADLYLTLQPGNGRVFLETFPLTKMDTQISTRFAKEIACNYFDLNCEQYDFIYTIRSKSSIVGGPSAGAAIAALTAAVVQGLEVDDSITVTGTINSGGLVGPVGGLKEKIGAAKDIDVSTVLIPGGTRFQEENNLTLDLASYAQDLDVTVLEVFDLNDLVYWLTGERLRNENYSLEVDEEYVEIMKKLANRLCDKTTQLKEELEGYNLTGEEEEVLKNKTISAAEALEDGLYYPAASYCFGANIVARNFLYEKENLTEEKFEQEVFELKQRLRDFELEIEEKSLKTITDLQTYSVVMERLNEAGENLEEVETGDFSSLAYASERLTSAQSWSEFFKMSGKEYEMDEEILENSCLKKIQEAKERQQYLRFFMLGNLPTGVQSAEKVYQEGNHKLCIVMASEAKAEIDALLSTIGVEKEKLDVLIEHKLKSLELSLARTIREGSFPILGYAYYQYAKDLRKENPGAALLYIEYALELGNLDMYFEEETVSEKGLTIPAKEGVVLFLLGAVFGAAFVLLVKIVFKKLIKTPRTTRKRSGGKKR